MQNLPKSQFKPQKCLQPIPTPHRLTEDRLLTPPQVLVESARFFIPLQSCRPQPAGNTMLNLLRGRQTGNNVSNLHRCVLHLVLWCSSDVTLLSGFYSDFMFPGLLHSFNWLNPCCSRLCVFSCPLDSLTDTTQTFTVDLLSILIRNGHFL